MNAIRTTLGALDRPGGEPWALERCRALAEVTFASAPGDVLAIDI